MRLLIDTCKTAEHQPGRLRGEITSQEIKKYVQCVWDWEICATDFLYCIPFTLVNFEGEKNVYYDLSTCDFPKNRHSRIYTLSLVLSTYFRARHSCANRLLCSTFLFAYLRYILYVGFCCDAICGTCPVVCATEFFAWLRSLFSPNWLRSFFSLSSCVCDDWGIYSGILNCQQGASCMGGNLLFYYCILSVVQPCFFFSITATIDYVCNLVLSFLYSWSISCFLKSVFYFV